MMRYIFSFLGASLILIMGLSYFSGRLQKDSNPKRVFTSEPIYWFGLDFSGAHFVGNFDQGLGIEQATADDLKYKWIPAWNNLILAEKANFNLRGAFHKTRLYYSISAVNEVNMGLNKDSLLSQQIAIIHKTDLQNMIKRYHSREVTDGLGAVFIIENFNKYQRELGLHVVFFDIGTKNILFSEFMVGEPMGFGLRNYWAGAIKDILHQIDFFEYPTWKNKYYYHDLYGTIYPMNIKNKVSIINQSNHNNLWN